MGFLGNLIGGGVTGLLMSGGNPIGGIAGALGGAITGSPESGLGGLSNAAFQAAENGYLAETQLMDMQQMQFQLQLQQQSNQFNNMVDEKSELMRETNTLRDVAMEQRKADIAITKEFIKSIG
jgi:hypothetical protein